jgi:hypothetical protein
MTFANTENRTMATHTRKPIGKSKRYDVLKRDNFTCQYCGRSAPEAVLEIDHRNPVSNGGSNNQDNLVTSCYDCNRGKSAKVDEESRDIDPSEVGLVLDSYAKLTRKQRNGVLYMIHIAGLHDSLAAFNFDSHIDDSALASCIEALQESYCTGHEDGRDAGAR